VAYVRSEAVPEVVDDSDGNGGFDISARLKLILRHRVAVPLIERILASKFRSHARDFFIKDAVATSLCLVAHSHDRG